MEYKVDVESNMGLVHMIAGKMRHLTNNGIVDYEDLVSDGVLGLIHAVERFDPEKGFKFSSYASMCIRGYMLRGNRILFKEYWKAKQDGIPSLTISMFWGEEARTVTGMDDHGENADWMVERTWRREIMERIRGFLTARQQQVMDLLIGEGLPQKEVAERLGVSRQLVSLCYNNTVKKARHHLAMEAA